MTTETATQPPRMAYRPDEAAKVLGTSRDRIFKLLAAGELRSFKIGQGRFISAQALEDFITRHDVQI